MTAIEFLKCFPGNIICTLDDKTASSATPHRDKPLPGLVSSHTKRRWAEKELIELNEKDAGIFFAYNNFGQDGTQRAKESVKGINAWAMEIDNIPKEEQLERISKSPIKPSIMVETRNSYHCYWLAKDGSVEKAPTILNGLIQHFNSDPALKNISVLLRIPGFNHNKNEPFKVKVVHLDNTKHTEEEMLKAFPYTPPKIKPREWKVSNTNDFWTAVNQMPTQVVLERLSGGPLVSGETFSFKKRSDTSLFIYVDERPANAWIDEFDKIGSGSGGGPTIVNWLMYYGRGFKEIADWVKENCKDLLPARLTEEKKEWKPRKKEKRVKKEKKFIPYTWGSPRMDATVWAFKRHEVLCLAGTTNSGKTAYAYYLARKNAAMGHRVCYAVLEMSAEEIADRAAEEIADFSIEEDRLEQYPEGKMAVYEEKKKELLGLPNLTMMDVASVPIEELYGQILEAGEFDMIVIDNFDRIKKSEGIENDYESDNHKIKTILDFTKIEKIPQILVHHINAKKRGGSGGYSLSDLRGSGKVPDECNTVFYVSRDCDPDVSDEDKAKFFIQAKKHRRKGQLVSTCLYFDKADFYDEYGGQMLEVALKPKKNKWEEPEYWQNI